MSVLSRFSAVLDEIKDKPRFRGQPVPSMGPERIRFAQALAWLQSAGAEGFGLDWGSFLAQIPEIPESLIPDRKDFPLLTLVAGHLDCAEICRRADLQDVTLGRLVAFDDSRALPKEWVWVRAHDGTPNRGLRPLECRSACLRQPGQFAGTFQVGGAIHLLHGSSLVAMDLPESVGTDRERHCCYLASRVADPRYAPHMGVNVDAGSGYGWSGTCVFVKS